MFEIFRYLVFVFFLFISTNSKALESDWSSGIESQVRLISASTKNNNESEIYVGLDYKLNDGWKTYWESPGDGGFPQEINWSNSINIKDVNIDWPVPNKFEILGMKSIGYSKSIIFPLKIKLIDPEEDTLIILDINYLVCEDICIPGNANLELLIPSGLGELTSHSFNLEKSISSLPKRNLKISFLNKAKTSLFFNEKFVMFKFEAEAKNYFSNPSIFLHTRYGLPVEEPTINYSNNFKKLNAIFKFDKNLIEDEEIETKIIISDNNQSFLLKEKLTPLKQEKVIKDSFLLILLISFVGGLILNIMPCVLPVLSIKLLSMLRHVDNHFSIRKSFLVTSLGIIFSFFLLSILLILFRTLGYSIGWGIQFQQPIFLIIISLILALFSLNMFGFFEIALPAFITSRLGKVNQKNNYMQDFLNGFFATVMATPCSAPFVGTALSFAFTQSSIVMLITLIAMGIGMSFPYFIIAFFPKLLKFIPKPGVWMIYVKYFLGLLLFLTLLWICNILLNHFNYYFLFFSFIILVIVIILNKFLAYKKTISFIGIFTFLIFSNLAYFKSEYIYEDEDWLDFNLINLENLINEDNIIFVDVTADWCTTCQYNKINVINSKEIKEIFNEYKVLKVKADWTKPNKNIENYLKKNNKFGIPFNIIYNKQNSKGIILSELLSRKEIFKTLNNL